MAKGFGARLKSLFGIKRFDESYFEELEELLIEGDLGSKLTMQISDEVRNLVRKKKDLTTRELQLLVKEQLRPMVHTFHPVIDRNALNVFLILGVNGVGKTTTIAKIARLYKTQGYSVTLAAADTFRAAAIDQLEVHANRVGVRIVKQESGSDPGAVVFDAITSARARGDQLLLVDTAGRMHNKEHLVRELAKIDKIVQTKGIDSVHYKKFLVIDSTTGQNGLSQATIFHQAIRLDALILSKYDSLAKGGALIQIGDSLGLPISFVGVGEKYGDLELFEAEPFLDSLVGLA
ncbi:MAG: Signal recognition particle receptor FtsY [Spirochaetes bacterium ADurb.Bin315]|jgi:fused signal recognition particle receptor|nr:MAG: Signal recognition particle receptor FtsY [Spirochaetes bacterium ADurb.Bin315]HNZ94930.1 signal recognition particle-docking protein FtsY [Sphaerochaeta sp.]HOE89195.1 signal recognition particle-docking protein FtsY [Sphaerochaeta sp.]HOR80459.1 signal recognition particle-docking protein FtsY [Sphaerochaeta sp.]HPB41954.1 signal recognition particle-docking protein FtsY [Sphaerochaeta sp.]